MKRKYALAVTLALLVSMLSVGFDVQQIGASGTIYIQANGSIEPSTANITTPNNVTYTLTGNINESIVIERSNIVVDGAGYAVQNEGPIPQDGIGITLIEIGNVTIKNVKVSNFYNGIYLYNSSGNTINSSAVTNNYIGIMLDSYSNHNVISHNNASNNSFYGFDVRSSCDGNILNNNTAFNNQQHGMIITSSNTTVTGNTISHNANGIYVGSSGNNTFFHNNFVNNTNQVLIASGTNVWNDDYPSGGNYWSDHSGVDANSGPNQDEPGSDGIIDTPYIIDEYNQDEYPLIPEYSSYVILLFFMLTAFPAALVYRSKRKT